LTNKVVMLLKNKTIEQAASVIAIAKPSPDHEDMVQNRGRGSEKRSKTPNEANMLTEINNLTQKTNPNEANKSFVLAVPPETNPNELNKHFRFEVPSKTNPNWRTRQVLGGGRHAANRELVHGWWLCS
jgi:hypothetical protein